VGGIGEKITEKANVATKKADYVLDVVRDKAGKAVGLVKDNAGNVVELITENIAKVAKVVAVSGIIAIGGLMFSCVVDQDGGTTTPPEQGPSIPQDPTPPQNPEEPTQTEKEKIRAWLLRTVLPVDVNNVSQWTTFPLNEWQGPVDQGITDMTKAVAAQAINMQRNINGNWRSLPAVNKQNIVPPDKEFLNNVVTFQARMLLYGHTPINEMLTTLKAKVQDVVHDNGDLFVAYVNAYRGLNYMSARHQEGKDDDYTTQINLGNGPVSIGDLLGEINANNGEMADYALDKPYPAPADLLAGAVALLPDDAYGVLGEDIIIEIGNFEQLLGLLQRAHSRDLDTTFSTGVAEEIGSMNNSSGNSIKEYSTIDKDFYDESTYINNNKTNPNEMVR
jgi:hypothetical protein